jgi:hypothetical protein
MCIFEFTWSFCGKISNIGPQSDHHVTSNLLGYHSPVNSNIDGASDIEYSDKLANYGDYIVQHDQSSNGVTNRTSFVDRRREDIEAQGVGHLRECFLRVFLGGGTRRLVVVEGRKWRTVDIVSHAVGIRTRKCIHRRLGYKKCGDVDVDVVVVTVCGCFLFFFVCVMWCRLVVLHFLN